MRLFLLLTLCSAAIAADRPHWPKTTVNQERVSALLTKSGEIIAVATKESTKLREDAEKIARENNAEAILAMNAAPAVLLPRGRDETAAAELIRVKSHSAYNKFMAHVSAAQSGGKEAAERLSHDILSQDQLDVFNSIHVPAKKQTLGMVALVSGGR